MKQVNVIIRANHRKTSENISVLQSTRSHLSYLKRQTDMYEFHSSNDLTESQFVQLLNKKQPFRLIVSPAKKCDMNLLVDKTIKTLCKYNNIKKLEYLSYIHYDTDHPHAHIIILPPKKKKDFKASGRFITECILPEINSYLTNIYGIRREEELKQEYISQINNIGQAKVDYDIKRICDCIREKTIDETGNYKKKIIYIYNKDKENKVESWKLPFIYKRINLLLDEKIGSFNKINRNYEFPENFIIKKIIKGKINKHLPYLPKDLDLNSVIFRKTPEKEVSLILSQIINKENHTLSRVVLTKNGQIELNEKKLRSALKEKEIAGRVI